MWPPKLLDQVCGVLFRNEGQKVQAYFRDYVDEVLKPHWTSQVSKLTGLIDLRDFAEDTIQLLAQQYDASIVGTPMDLLIRSIKNSSDAHVRRNVTVAFIRDQAMSMSHTIGTEKVYRDLAAYVLSRETDIFYKHSADIVRYRPMLPMPVEAIESTVRHMESVGSEATLDHFLAWASGLGLKTLWPVLALWDSNANGTVETTFLHVPMPRVFGAPSCVRNAIEKRAAPSLCKFTHHSNVQLDRIVLAGQGTLAFRERHYDETTSTFKTSSQFKTLELPQAYLVAGFPGTSRPMVWCLNPKTLGACVVDLSAGRSVLEFDVPHEDHDAEANWIDCQRDSEGRLVLMWGHINSLTGALGCQNVMGLDEDSLEPFDVEPSGLPNRSRVGTRVDYRDHGNLLSVHHVVHDVVDDTRDGKPGDGKPSGPRVWNHVYQVVFGQYQILEMSSKSRPVTAIFGSPLDFVMLSPLSSTSPLQLWSLTSSIEGSGETYTMTHSCAVPKLCVGSWASIALA